MIKPGFYLPSCVDAEVLRRFEQLNYRRDDPDYLEHVLRWADFRHPDVMLWLRRQIRRATPVVESGTTSINVSGATSVTPGDPVGISNGELVFKECSIDGDKTASADPGTGWTELYLAADTAGEITGGVWYCLWTGAESTQITWSGTDRATAGAWRMTGFNTSSPIDAGPTFNEGTDDTPVSPSVTTGQANCLVFRTCQIDNKDWPGGHDTGEPASHTIIYSIDDSGSSNNASGAAYVAQASAGASGTATWATFAASDQWIAHSWSVAPAAAATGNPHYYYAQQ